MQNFIIVLQIVMAVSLIALILIQNSKGGLNSSISDGQMYRSRRGAEKIIFMATIAISSLFFLTSVINLFVR